MAEPIECAACSSRGSYVVEQWPTGKRARAIACPDCGVLFVHPLPSPDGRGAHDAAYDGWVAACSPRRVNAPTKKGAALALMAALDLYLPASSPPAGARVLSLGAGTAAWLNCFRARGWETFGTGRSSDPEFAHHKPLTAMPADPQFDLVVVYQVLERLARPLDSLRELARAIRFGGHCLISVPRLDTLAVHGQIRYCLRPGKHVAAFTESCLRGLLARSGLEVVAALHDLDYAFTPGEPLRLRLLARRVEAPMPEPDPAAALRNVFTAVSALAVSTSRPAGAPSLPPPSECPACAGGDIQVVEEWRLSGSQARAAACGDCGLLFVHPAPSRQALDAYYAPDGGWRASRAGRQRGAAFAHGRPEGAAAVIFPALDRFFPASAPVPGARVFDFGCGTGGWLDAFQERGWDTYGLEPSTEAAFVRHKRVLLVPSEPQFDLVMAYHVLEHLARPLDTLRELARALVTGGYCLVSVPRLDTLAVHRQVDYCLHPRHHIVGFTEACLRGLLARAGLEVVAAFHELDSARANGLSVRLQLLARKGAVAPVFEPDAAAALERVIAAYAAVRGAARYDVSPGDALL